MAFQVGSPGKKLVFMGQEFGQWREWGHDRSIDWYLAEVGFDNMRLFFKKKFERYTYDKRIPGSQGKSGS